MGANMLFPVFRPSGSSGMFSRMRAKNAFTLIELLVVISILALLMAFIIPTFFGTKDKGNIARAKVEAKQLETAWKQFFLTYNRWPPGVSSDNPIQMSGDIVKEIGGLGGSVNTRGIPFFDVPINTNPSPVYKILDPWRNEYNVVFDHNFDSSIDLPSVVGGGKAPRTVVVYTIFVTTDYKTNIIKSWD